MTCPLNSSSLLSALEVAVRATAVGSPAWRVRGNYDALVLCDALARTNTTAAVALFRSILATQGDDGHFPFASYEGSPPAAATGPDWDGCAPPASFWGQTGVPSLVAPPAHATVARRLYQFSANDDDDEEVLSFLRDEAFAALFKWHSHLFGERLSADNATVFIVHPWESPMMDPPELDGPLTRADAGGLPVPALASRCSAAFAPTSQGSDIDRFRQALRLATCVQNRSARQEVPQTIARQCGFQVRSVAVNSMLLRSTADLLAIADLIDSRVPKGGAPHDAEAESLSQWATALAQAIKQADTFDFPRTVAKGDAGLVAALPSDQDLLNGTTAARCPSSSLGISVLLGSSKTTVKTEAQAQLAASVLGPDLWTKYPLRMAAPSLCAGTSSGRCATSMLGQDILTQALDSYVPQDSSAPFASVASYIRGSTVGLLCDRLGPRGAGVDRLPGAIDPISGVALPTLPGPVSNISSSIAGTCRPVPSCLVMARCDSIGFVAFAEPKCARLRQCCVQGCAPLASL